VPQDNRIEFRIGLNVGDVVVEDGDIFGDGVNVAARLEGLAEPSHQQINEAPVYLTRANARGTGSLQTRRWRRQSRANPSLESRFPGYWEKYRETHSNSDAHP
jgi:class 3 adenylate cyclase